ncbi:MAG: V-type ATP synthase subunit E [Meiothermus sp.]|uniref:V-type ATP synthase subunit E n=1 Tax=Meiothermus sp. TaxID=1955249 RepID=UPI0025F0F2EB|nr:V-type ATP synthase subunit E [Meiothermus sp.]MCS7058437.1 V-type ATP synthase subunit E [Meiothermus sp.]MCS7195057.1 V-type ATP synthase subunit E [Meiothermus sp.]MCX7739595.1 V-type ATP synthase subunit E [Meiothermus sp.]MDW8090835.1 V-type ATP synthase subunit E [Meiothermus sp.]MDW8482470.1 V-type ATP synthase subunit E [Meiothermus sp.]
MSKLEDILQSEVAAEIAAIEAEAEAKVKEILEAARVQAEALKASRQRALEAEHAAALRRAESAAELLVNQARIAARGKVVEEVRLQVLRALEALSAQPQFGETLKRLAEEALQSVGQAEALVVHPDHAALLSEWARGKGLALSTDAALKDGVRLVMSGGRAFVQNSLSERLERAWDGLSARAAAVLWGQSAHAQ